MGLNSLPVAFGVDKAKWITVGTIDVTQIAVAAYLAFGRQETTYAAVLSALILPQVGLSPHISALHVVLVLPCCWLLACCTSRLLLLLLRISMWCACLTKLALV